MNWKTLTSDEQLTEINEASAHQPIVIFKHSTRCSISSMAKSRLERAVAPTGLTFYYLDLIAHRDVSNKIADTWRIPHESPQVLLIRNGVCVYDESHNGIRMEEIEEKAASL
ncbi:bacillithiol system redox-active protein YtxJ [Chitinophaga nivalis]|uniref:Bacillithiol system redox-active protein YtxJ n=1 Tax=Chitinophaga nivalis TaxID=2991709 RepID=A0ABT3IR55_9BACT|nr:bacillithiol system redox-active protein YtxJ [Chitinophaga nivalis]MCW3463877.1 bacillithiol system redox-active protein YtxJ [Chitinophaga nivalis]MCW3486433.1 bacillithiol system redox-active protein YtxJ [Chitinophaga nivalis]